MEELLRWVAVRGMAVVAVCALVPAVASGQNLPQLQGLLKPEDAPERPRVLVLKTGQVIQGEIEPQVGGYMVTIPNGRVLITYDQVWAAALSLPDAYSRMSANRSDPTANDRLELARWCYQNGLVEEARIEISAGLRLAPDRPEARQLLQRIERSLQQRRPTETAATFGGLAAASPAGPAALSGERTSEFVRIIQPILLNRCGNATCHGTAATNAFRLQPALGGRASQSTSETNLAAVLTQISLETPDASPLLTAAQTQSGVHRNTFRGPRAEDQVTALQKWVRAVSAETGGAKRASEAVEGDASRHPLMTALAPVRSANDAALLPAGTPQPNRGAIVEPAAVSGRIPKREDDVDEAFLRKIVAETAPDPFDPEEFNRLVHGIESGAAR